MVVASEAVETICQEKNGLSFVDLLRPFGEQTNVNAPLRVSGQAIRITEARLRFSYGYTMEQPTAEVIDCHLKDVVQQISEATVKDTPHRLEEGPLKSTPWFLKYRQDFLQLLCFDAHETVDHPLGCIYAVSSAEVDSLKAFEELIENSAFPTLMLQEHMAPVADEDCGKLFVIVHDGSKEGQTGLELAREKVRLVQKEYGHDNCTLLLINTSGGREELRGEPPIAFDALRPVAVRGGGAGEHSSDVAAPKDGWGCFLSKADLERINELVRNFMTRCFFPKLDVRLGRLRSSVSLKRRGIAGKFMDRTSSLLKSSLSNIGRDAGAALGFKYYSDEAQMRQLGDILFLLGRFEDALEVFGSISISKEAFPRFYAGIQFIMGLCYAVLVGFADPSVYFGRAYDYYIRVPGKTSRMFATRAAMIQSAYCLGENRIAAAAQALLKGYDTEEMLRGALLLEEAAILLLRTEPPCFRKFAFQMTLAGVWFYNCLFHKLSLRCYNLILDIYTNKQWLAIEQHVASMMLKFHLEQGNNADAFSWTIDMLTSQHALTPEIQKEYIQWICSYIKEAPSHAVSSIADFNLPVLHLDTMQVRFEGEVVSGSAMADEVDSAVWLDLESRFRDPYSASTTTGLVLMNSGQPIDEPYGWVVCGEAVRFSCVFENPLQTPVNVTSAQLLFEFERTDDSCSPTSSPVSIPETSFSLRESEKAVMQLQLIINTPGRLRIIGVSWYLNGLIPGHKLFGRVSWEGKDRLPFRAKVHYPILLFVALEPVPRLLLSSAPVPVRLWKGELWKTTWNFDSVGKISFRNLQITTSSRDLTFAPASDKGTEDEIYVKDGVYQMELGDIDGMQLDLCLNPQSTGQTQIHTVIRYEAPESETPLRVRFLRHSFRVEVMEPLHLQSWLTSSELSRALVLAMELENRNEDTIFDVTAIEADTSKYQIQYPEGTQLPKVLPGEKLMHHVLVKETEENSAVTFMPNGRETAERSSSASDGEALSRAPHSDKDSPQLLGISLQWSSSDRQKEASHEDKAVPQAVHHHPRHGCVKSTHDVAALASKVALKVSTCTMTQSMVNGVATFDVTVELQNVSDEPLSLSFSAGEDWSCAERCCWKQSIKLDKEEEYQQAAGLSPIPTWSWSGQTERQIPFLQPSERTEVHAEIVCFLTGCFSVVDYCCKWKSLGPVLSNGVIPGKPLYLTVSQDLSHESVIAE